MIKTIENYFKGLAESHIKINGFVSRSFEEAIQGIHGSELKFPVLVLESFDWRLVRLKSDNPSRLISGAFHIVDEVRDNRNFDAYKHAEEICDPIATQVINKLLKAEYLFLGDEAQPIKFVEDNSQGLFLGKNTYSERQAGVRYQIDFAVNYETQIDDSVWQ